MNSIAFLLISLGIILLAAELFVNGVEWLGKLFNLSEGAVGSVLAAVGTALPETIIPIIALLFNRESDGHAIGIGAILGAPLMLATLAMFVTGAAVIIFRRKRINGTKVVADYSTMSRDLGFFIIVFTAAVLAGTLPPELRHWQLIIAGFMVFSYIWYVYEMLTQERDLDEESEMPVCYFARKYENPPLYRVTIQVLLALTLIIVGANLFVNSVSDVAAYYGIHAFVLSIIITPIATELPEKFNSVIWISRSKDTLALGNITGAMVFQSSLIPALGIFLTDWQLTSSALVSAILAISAAALLYIELVAKKHVSATMLLISGIFYIVFLVAVFQKIIV
ncbi:Sodium/calcium exchanger membrane region [Syntrophomonas zehnderi OL-4]|uniref:Sodium/calcium exchanger membrane region n=1 Tax=Syntrophomonas zehnderi OL-4 TaxID=690567 RepID=A0A0E3W3U9_9FIRM|nr:sodium:calcium antiporter [Syntrophomonas zehnderi]CFY06474.1 Sodium/calcium exchanger membrane region [Syntrophomonas zehnderi OL-4]